MEYYDKPHPCHNYIQGHNPGHSSKYVVLIGVITCCLCKQAMIGASLSEPHIDEFAVNFPYIYFFIYIYIVRRAVNHFLLVFCVSLRHALIQTTNELTIATSTT